LSKLECYKYLDSKPVYMLSTKHGSSLSTTSRRNRITNEIIREPNVVTNYNKYMGGVDRSLSNCWGTTDGLPTLLTVLVGLLETSWDTNCFLNNLWGLYHSYQEYVLAYRRWKVCNATPDEE
jgi:hypothetical protein